MLLLRNAIPALTLCPSPRPCGAQVPPLLPIQQNVFVPQQTKAQQAAQQQGQGVEGQGPKAEPGQEVKVEGGEGLQGAKAEDVAMKTEDGQAAQEAGELQTGLGCGSDANGRRPTAAEPCCGLATSVFPFSTCP